MGIIEVVSPELGRVGHFSRAVEAKGRLIFLSGQAPIDPESGLVPTEFSDQVGLCLAKMGLLLRAAGGGLGDLARLTFYVVGRARLEELPPARRAPLKGRPIANDERGRGGGVARPPVVGRGRRRGGNLVVDQVATAI